MKSHFFFFILLFNLLALGFGQYDFFDDYVKKFLKNIFQGGRNNGGGNNGGRTSTVPPRNSLPDLRPQSCDCSLRNGKVH